MLGEILSLYFFNIFLSGKLFGFKTCMIKLVSILCLILLKNENNTDIWIFNRFAMIILKNYLNQNFKLFDKGLRMVFIFF